MFTRLHLIDSPLTVPPRAIVPQSYPRDSSGLLEESALVAHTNQLPQDELERIIRNAIVYANLKSSATILNIDGDATDEEKATLYIKGGKELFEYFKKYCGDPAATTADCLGRHYRVVAGEQFKNRALQKIRMNAGWRYQYIAKECASKLNRFTSVSDLGSKEADFIATLKVLPENDHKVSIYISVKNRTNTLGGQDWPKAISALEAIAKNDQNRSGPYLCVFGIAMEKGNRFVKATRGSSTPYSFNTEVWRSDFFWKFFTNFTYEHIITTVLQVIQTEGSSALENPVIPTEVAEEFGRRCEAHGLLDEQGMFNSTAALIRFFCT